MRKRTATTTLSADVDTPRRHKTLRKSDASPDTAPKWLHDAAASFVSNTPSLHWTGGFYSWGTWLEALRALSLWTSSSPHSKPAWRALIDVCKASGQVRGTAALYRAKSDLVAIIVNSVFRLGEVQRVTHDGETPAAERDIMRRVRAVVTRQRRHEAVALTLIRFLDLAFVLSAYKDCRLASAIDQRQSPVDVSAQVEDELRFFELGPNAREIRALTAKMEAHMWENRWLPWYEQVPGVRDEMVIQAREAALSFCHGLPFPRLKVSAGVRGLSRDHLAGAGSMDEWLIGLLEPGLTSRWVKLAEVYETAMRDQRGEEDALLEETSRRVLQTVLEPLIEIRDGLDACHSKLIDAAPGIVVTQSVRISGRFTFRQLLELYIHLKMFGQHLHATFRQSGLPSVDDIRSGVVLFEEIRRRTLEVRAVIESDKVDMLLEWCLATQMFLTEEPNPQKTFVTYQQVAVKAALGSALVRYAANPNASFPEAAIAQSDPLTYAATVGEWDAQLAANIIDAAVRLGPGIKERFSKGQGEGWDLYSYRRITVCDAALERFGGNILAAAKMMRRLHPVWEACEQDKKIGLLDRRGVLSLQIAAENGNFEAAALYGVVMCSLEWSDRRRQFGIQTNIDSGMSYICKAISMGDTGAAIDVVHLLKSNPGYEQDQVWHIPQQLVAYAVQCLKDASREEPCMRLFLGYLYSVGVTHVQVDYKAAMRSYQIVLDSMLTSTRYQAYAANNLGVLQILNAPGVNGGVPDNNKAMDYVKAAATSFDAKAEANLGALLCLESRNSCHTLESAKQTYWRYFESGNCSSPVAVLQTDGKGTEVTVFEMMIASQERARFCRDLRSEGMPLERYGTILSQVTLPYSPVSPPAASSRSKS